MIKGLQRTIDMYTSRGFQVTYLIADNELKCAKTALIPSHLNVVPRNVHVPNFERSIRTTKEIVRCTSSGLPYKRIPRIMVTSIGIRYNSQLKNIPDENGVSIQISPTTIIAGLPSPDENTMKRIPFGAYAQGNEDHPRNDLHRPTTHDVKLARLIIMYEPIH